jgi:two-component system catabolic regulation response regulator CreB
MKPRLLLLEDDPAISQTVVFAFEREGFEVLAVSLLSQAREALAQRPEGFEAAILDVGLPDGSGLDLCRQWRQSGHAAARLPLLMLSARSEEIDRVLGLELGADDYVSKPFSPRELVARVRALLRRSGSNAATKDSAAETSSGSGLAASPRLVCDAGSGRALWQGQALPLTRREWQLLQVLLTQPDRIWSRDALLDAAWGERAEFTDRTVDTHIKTLRAKLREAGAEPELIATHRGLGYALQRRCL